MVNKFKNGTALTTSFWHVLPGNQFSPIISRLIKGNQTSQLKSSTNAQPNLSAWGSTLILWVLP